MMVSPEDRALDLLASDQPAAALRWSVAALEQDPGAPRAIFVTSRALARLGGGRVAMDGLRLAARRAVRERDLPLALAAIAELRAMRGSGGEVGEAIEEIAVSVLGEAGEKGSLARALPFAAQAHVRPLSPFVGERALVSRATQVLYESAGVERHPASALGFLAGVSEEAVRELLLSLETATVPAGHCLIEEGETSDCAFLLVSGGAEVWRRSAGSDGRVLATLERGSLFGELALLAPLAFSASPASVVATRGSVVLVLWREAVEAIGAKHIDLRLALTTHCKRQAAANLGAALGVLDAVPLLESAALVERLELRLFDRGERLASLNEPADGVHVILSGEVLRVARDGGERVVLETLGSGATVGETELVLCRNATTEAIAVQGTATLFLPRDEFFALTREYPAILQGFYGAASRRHAETTSALEAGAAAVEDDCVIEEAPEEDLPAAAPIATGERSSRGSEAPGAARDGRVERREVAPPPRVPEPTVIAPAAESSPPFSARAAIGISASPTQVSPTSLAPAVLSHRPPRSSAPAPGAGAALRRIPMRATVAFALAAGVAAAIVPHADRGPTVAAAGPSRAEPLPLAEPTPPPAAAAVAAPPSTATTPTASAEPTAAAAASTAPSAAKAAASASPSHPHPRAPSAPRPATTIAATPTAGAAPADSAATPRAGGEADRPRAGDESAFGGRE
jgi:CRP-like cAMP-binding protein